MATPYPIVPGVRFKDIPDWPGYCVGDDGSVWSCKIVASPSGQVGDIWRERKLTECKNGYMYVGLRNTGKSRNFLVHRLVLEAFVGPCPSGMECRHLDGNRANNRMENLVWGTSAENSADMMRHGTAYRKPGEDAPNAILTEAIVCEILKIRAAEGIGAERIAKRLGIGQKWAVSSVIHGQSWNHVSGMPRRKRGAS